MGEARVLAPGLLLVILPAKPLAILPNRTIPLSFRALADREPVQL